MSCNSTPCNTITSPGCGVDLCSTTKLSTNSVIYTGPTLACSGISNCDSVTDAFQKLDYRLCNLPTFTITANNGLTKLLNNIQLGGPLIQQTVIETTAANSLVISGLVTIPPPQFLVSQNNSGALTRTTITSILAILTSDNGITKTSNNFQLGGPLLKPTTITTDPINTLTLAGLVTNPTPAFIITQAASGELVKTLISSIVPPPAASITANNGLNMSTLTNVQLGGLLQKNTSVNLDIYTLSLKSAFGSQTGIQIIPGFAQDCIAPGNTYDWNTDIVNVDSKLRTLRPSWFQGNVGVGVQPDSNNSNCGNGTSLVVEKARTSWNTTFSGVRTSTTTALTLQGALGNDSSNGVITSGTISTLNVASTNSMTLKSTANAIYSGLSGMLTFSGSNGGLGITGTLASVASRSLFSDAGNIKDPGNNGPSLTTYVGFQALSPQAFGGVAYTGTLENAVGVQIEDQRTRMGSNNTQRTAGLGLIVNSWGVKQLGTLDRNLFYGNTGIGTDPYPAVDTVGDGNNAKLYVARSTSYRTSSLTAATDSVLQLNFVGTEDQNFYTGTSSRLILDPQSARTLVTPETGAIIGYVQSIAQNGENIINSRPISGVIGKCYFDRRQAASTDPAGGDITSIASIKASCPVANAAVGYGGTIENVHGVFIEDQRAQIIDNAFTGYITSSYGVYQEGAKDTNYFKGAFQLPSSNLSIGTATLVAGTVTVATTAVKTGAKIFLSVNTPGGTQGFLSAPAASITNGVSFVINSSDVADTSTVNWWIINS